MERAESESRGYEREVKYQIEEKERREWEDKEVRSWLKNVEANAGDWQKQNKDRLAVSSSS